MYLAEFSALAAALCWSFGGLLSTSPARAFGALRFNRIRLTIVASLLAVVVFLLGSWKSLDGHSLWILMLSAVIGMGFLSALCQSISVLIARPIMVSGVDAVAASALRVGTAALLLNLVFFLRVKPQESNVSPMTGKLMALIAMSGTVGMALGMTFILFALAHGPSSGRGEIRGLPPGICWPDHVCQISM